MSQWCCIYEKLYARDDSSYFCRPISMQIMYWQPTYVLTPTTAAPWPAFNNILNPPWWAKPNIWKLSFCSIHSLDRRKILSLFLLLGWERVLAELYEEPSYPFLSWVRRRNWVAPPIIAAYLHWCCGKSIVMPPNECSDMQVTIKNSNDKKNFEGCVVLKCPWLGLINVPNASWG